MQTEPMVETRELWRVLWERRRLIAIVSLVCVFAAGIYGVFRSPTYRAEAVIQIEPRKNGVFVNEEKTGREGMEAGAIAELEILRSRMVLEPVIRNLGLDVVLQEPYPGVQLRIENYDAPLYGAAEQPAFRAAFEQDGSYVLFDSVGKRLGSGQVSQPFQTRGLSMTLFASGFAPGQEVWFRKLSIPKSVDELQRSLQIAEVAEKTNLIRLAVEMGEPHQAADIVNAVAHSYVSRNVAYRSREAEQTVAFLEGQLNKVESQLHQSEQELGSIKTKRGVYVPAEESARIIQQISKLEIDQAELELRHRQLQHIAATLEKAKGRNEAYLLGEQSIADKLTNDLVQQLSTLLVELRGMRERYTDRTPKVRQLKQKVWELKAKIRAAIRNGLETTGAQLESSREMLAQFEERLKNLPAAEREIAPLTRRADVDADLYTFLLKKHEEAQIAQAAIVGNIRVIDEALPPETPSGLGTIALLVLGLLVGLCFGVAASFTAEYFDDSIRDGIDAADELDLPVLSQIPEVEGLIETDCPRIDRMGARSSFVESFRSLQAELRLGPDAASAKVIVCAGAESGDGKTTVAINLATALADNGRRRVLLVDADLRRPALHRLLEVSGEPGLREVLEGQTTRGKVSLRTAVEGLWLLPAGEVPLNPVALLESPNLKTMLGRAKQDFDYVIVDVPPCNLFSDAGIVAAVADATLFVAAISQSELPGVQRAVAHLSALNARVLGLVLTRAKQKVEDEYRRYYASHPPKPSFLHRFRRYILST